MTRNKFEESRISESSLEPGAQHPGEEQKPPEESKAISRDDERDGVVPPGQSDRTDKEHRGRAGLPL